MATILIDGREIETSLTVGRVRQAKEKHGINIADVVSDEGPLKMLAVDPSILSDILWAFYSDRLQSAGFGGKKQLDDAMDAKAVDSAYKGLAKEFADFFPWGAGFSQLIEGLRAGVGTA